MKMQFLDVLTQLHQLILIQLLIIRLFQMDVNYQTDWALCFFFMCFLAVYVSIELEDPMEWNEMGNSVYYEKNSLSGRLKLMIKCGGEKKKIKKNGKGKKEIIITKIKRKHTNIIQKEPGFARFF